MLASPPPGSRLTVSAITAQLPSRSDEATNTALHTYYTRTHGSKYDRNIYDYGNSSDDDSETFDEDPYEMKFDDDRNESKTLDKYAIFGYPKKEMSTATPAFL